jgi:hypothetical protein
MTDVSADLVQGRSTATLLDKMPPLRPFTTGGKAAISCEKPGEFLVRAWATTWTKPATLVDWICHHIGRMSFEGLEWWGYTYPGLPPYMDTGKRTYESGLTIQRFVPPCDSFTLRMLNEGRLAPGYGPPVDLAIPATGQIQTRHFGSIRP